MFTATGMKTIGSCKLPCTPQLSDLIRVKLEVMEYFLPGRIFQSTVRLRSAIGGKSVRERSVGMQSCASIAVMCHRDIQHQRVRRKRVVFSAWQDHVILDLHVSTFIAYSWGDFVDFNPVTKPSVALS